jgi:catechol 2,3-dioxygenase-like lactoylglutathione lyase family enzyme
VQVRFFVKRKKEQSMRFGHVNIVARDWRRLVDFYVAVFACELLQPERNLSGPIIEAGLGIAGAALQGVHVRLPGYGQDGPTLEIYRYEPLVDVPANVRRSGFGHIAFAVDDIVTTRHQVLAHGGSAIGEIVTTSAGARQVSWCYVTDPEGNGIELQTWHLPVSTPSS